MIHYQRDLTIDSAPQNVWAVLSRFMEIGDFAPEITKVEALSQNPSGLGAKRRCHFKNGSNLVEEVTQWDENRRYRVKMTDLDPMPLKESYAEIAITPNKPGKTKVIWSMDYRVKYGPIGWLMGQTVMKMMMGGILDANLKGLADLAKKQKTG